MGVAFQALLALRRIGLIILIALTFLFGLATTVYLSLRSSEVTVPEVVGKDRFEAERILSDADLNFRVRATRPSNQVKADTVLFQLPRAGEVVKVGQTVAMDVSRAAKEGEASEAVVNDKKASEERSADSRNTNESLDTNENKPKRIKNINKNANANANANGNINGNTNANAGTGNSNLNRPRTVSTPNDNATGNSNSTPVRNANQNENKKPPVIKPSPSGQNINRQP